MLVLHSPTFYYRSLTLSKMIITREGSISWKGASAPVHPKNFICFTSVKIPLTFENEGIGPYESFETPVGHRVCFLFV